MLRYQFIFVAFVAYQLLKTLIFRWLEVELVENN